MNFFQAEKGGSGGVNNYPDLTNKPQINGVELSGNQTAAQLGLAPAGLNLSGIQLLVSGVFTNDNHGTLTLPSNIEYWTNTGGDIWILQTNGWHNPSTGFSSGVIRWYDAGSGTPAVILKFLETNKEWDGYVSTVTGTKDTISFSTNVEFVWCKFSVFRILI